MVNQAIYASQPLRFVVGSTAAEARNEERGKRPSPPFPPPPANTGVPRKADWLEALAFGVFGVGANDVNDPLYYIRERLRCCHHGLAVWLAQTARQGAVAVYGDRQNGHDTR